MFVYKNTAELEKLTAEELDQYKTELKTHETKQLENQISETVKNAIEKAKTDLKDFLGQEVAGQLAEKETVQTVDVRKAVKDFLIENSEKIKSIYKTGQGAVEFQLKAVGDISTASGTNTSPPAITGTQQAPLQNVNLRNFDVTALTTNVNTSMSAYAYTEAKPKDGDYSFVAEGGTKPQTDFTWETNYAKPVKAAAWVRLTEESIQDVAGLESVVYDLLAKKHQIKKSKGILYGDGISPNPKGATEYGRAFVSGDMAGAVVNPNFMDVINACITDIATTHNYEDEMPYMANIVLVNPIDFYIQLVSAKDENGLPLYPQASLFNVVNIGGVSIYPEETIPAGKIFVCDMSKYNTTKYIPYNVRIGWINDDQIKNQFLIIAESRFHAFVKKLDEQAFIYDDIATIKTAITKEESVPSV